MWNSLIINETFLLWFKGIKSAQRWYYYLKLFYSGGTAETYAITILSSDAADEADANMVDEDEGSDMEVDDDEEEDMELDETANLVFDTTRPDSFNLDLLVSL